MSVLEFRMPDIGEGVSEGEIVEWHAKAGDSLNEDDPMVEVMTDKATVTIGSPCDGSIEELLVGVGEKARVGQVIVRLAVRDGASAPKRWSSPPATAVGDLQETLPGTEAIGGSAGEGAGAGTRAGTGDEEYILTDQRFPAVITLLLRQAARRSRNASAGQRNGH